ncbi:MAG: dihydrofolate reductase [Muribaculaceae bacterium]
MPQISIIVALASDGAIGRRGDLLYHVSADLRRFKALTTGNTVVMGRKTFESLPKGALPDRRNIVISRDSAYRAAGADTYTSLDEAIASCAPDDKVFIIGGAQIYRLAMPLADELLVTRFDRTEPDADTFFPDIDEATWTLAESGKTETDPKTGVGFRFDRYVLRSRIELLSKV